jgi:hypothetical protein
MLNSIISRIKMNTSESQPIQAGYITPPRRERPAMMEPPAIIPNKRRRGHNIPQNDVIVTSLTGLLNQMTNNPTQQ